MDATALQRRLLRQISTYGPEGETRKLRPALKKAFMACPRHRFLKRFVIGGGLACSLNKRTQEQLLPVIYSDGTLQFYADKSGKPLPASNSQPGYVMYLLEMLDLRRGLRVMEVGSGGGWLSAIIAQVVGPKGHAVGIELIPELADHSRRCIRSLGREIDLGNLTILTGDGGEPIAPSQTFDRVMVTAGSQSFPAAFFEQVVDGGKVLIPLSYRGGGEEVRLLRKEGNCFRSIAAISGRFVPLVGSSRLIDFDGVALDDLPIWRSVREQPCFSQQFWLGGRTADSVMPRSFAFRSYLSKTEPGYEVFIKKKNGKGPPSATTFGLVDDRAGSLALVEGSNLVGFGSPKAAETMIRNYRTWTKAFMPPGWCFDLSIFRSGEAPRPKARQWREQRGPCDFVWSLSETAH